MPVDMPPDYPQRYLHAFERWATRPRLFDDERAGMEHTLEMKKADLKQALLEKAQVQTKPQYRAYIESTSAFLPWFPRRQRSQKG